MMKTRIAQATVLLVFSIGASLAQSNPHDVPLGQELLIQGSSANGHLNVQKPGFQNEGRIRMESIQAGYSSSLTITEGWLTNEASGEIVANGGSGGARNITGDILNLGLVQDNYELRLNKTGGHAINEGVWNVAEGTRFFISGGGTPKFTQRAGSLNILGGTDFEGVNFGLEGGSITGTVYMVNSQLTVPDGSEGTGSFIMSGGSSLLDGNLYNGQSLWLRGESRGSHSTLRAVKGFSNEGELKFESIQAGYASNFQVDGTLTNRGMWITGGGAGGARVFTGNLLNLGEVSVRTGATFSSPNGVYENAGVFTIASGGSVTMNGQGQVFRQSAGSLGLTGGLNIYNARFEYMGGMVSGTPYLINSTLQITDPGEGSFIVTGGTAGFEGNIYPGQSVWIRGDSVGSHTQLTSAGTFQNRGTILLESIQAGYSSFLGVTEGAVQNKADGIIRSGGGAGGPRILRGNVENEGLLDVAYTLTLERQDGAHVNSGEVRIASGATLNVHGLNQSFTHAGGMLSIDGLFYGSGIGFHHSGGVINGTLYLVNSAVTIGPGAGAANYIISGSGTAVAGNIRANQSVWVRGDGTGSHTRVTSASGFENKGIIRFESISAGYNSSWTIDGRLTNAESGILRINPGAGGTRNIEAEVLNAGVFEGNYSFTLSRANAVHENRGRWVLAAGQTMNVPAGQTFVQRAGTLELNGLFHMTNARFEHQGGSISGVPYIVNSELAFGPDVSAPADFILTGSGSKLIGNIPLNNTVWIRGDSGGSHTTVTAPAGFANGGRIRLESISAGYNSSLTVGGTLSNLQSGSIVVNPGTGGARNLTADLLNEGRFEANYSLAFNKPAAAVINAGEFIVAGGNTVTTTADYVQRGGFTRVNGTLDPVGVVHVQRGNLGGSGSVAANVSSSGILTPGSSVGILRILGDYAQEASGTLEVELGGVAAGSEYDQLQVSGSARIDGALALRLVGGFVPSEGDQFTVLTANNTPGGFKSFDLPALPAGQRWEITYGGGVILKVLGSGALAGRIKGSVKTQGGLGLSGVTVTAYSANLTYSGLRGDYFHNSDFTESALNRLDGPVDFSWGNGSPHASIAADSFSVRWTGFVEADFSEEYTFYTVSDDGVRLWVNGQALIDNWGDHAPVENSGTITLEAGERYEIRMDYYENGGGATARLLWSSPSQPKAPIPDTHLTPSSTEGLEPRSALILALSAVTDASGAYSLDVGAGDWVVEVNGLSSLGYDSPPEQYASVTDTDVIIDFVAPPYSGEFFTIALEANPPGTGIFTGGGRVAAGSAISVTASANTQLKPWIFVNWTEDGLVQSSEPDYTFVANRDRTLRANFKLPTYTIAAQATPEGSGTISGAGNFLHDSAVTLQAKPNFGWRFEKWTEDGADLSDNPKLAFAAARNRSLTAHFVTTIPADLTVTEVKAPETAMMGQPVHVVYTLHNSGAEPASGPWVNQFILATNETEGSTIDLGIAPFAGTIPAESSLVVTQALILPPGLAGDYFLMVTADAKNALQETREDNNTGSTAETFTILAADLVVELSSAPEQATFGDKIPLAYKITNTGNAAAMVPFTDRIELVSGTKRVVLLSNGTSDVVPLAAGGFYTREVEVQLPLASDLQPGEYSLVVATDARGEQPEVLEDNNVDSLTIALNLPPLPDLAITEIRIPFLALPGSDVELIWTVANQGLATAEGPWRESLFVSADDLVGADELIGSFDFEGALAPGESISRTNVLRIPVSLAGSLRWVAAVDTRSTVVEGDEANNSTITSAVSSIPIKLSLVLPFEQVVESRIPPSFRGRVFRSGPISEALLVNLASSDAAEISVPATVSIPAGSASAEFDATVIADGVVDGPKEVLITGTAEGVGSGSDNVRVLDMDVPKLTFQFASPGVTEGMTVSATVSRSITDTNDVDVSISASSLEIIAPATVIIPAGSDSVTFAIMAVDDDRLEPTLQVGVSAAAAGYIGDSDQVNVLDNDDPGLNLKIENTTISEGAGGLATSATVTRQTVTSKPLLVQVRESDSSEIALAPTVVIPGNVSSAFFYISAVNDTIVDGDQEVTVSAFVGDPSTGEPVSAVASGSITVTDDDGPALRISLSGSLAREGRDPAVTALIRRNTDTAEPLEVRLASSDTSEATVAESAIIPAGSDSVSVDVVSLNDNTPDGNQPVIISISADGFAGASANFIVSDSDLPDLVVSQVTAPAAGLTKAMAAIGYTVTNQGFDTASGNFVQKVYLSRDTVFDPNDTLLSTTPFIGELPIGQSFSRSLSVFLPGETGNYWVFVVCDSEKTIVESVENNNLSGSAHPIQVNPAYTATVQTEVTVAPSGNPVPLTGRAVRPDNSPAVAEAVSIHITVQGQRRTIAAITDLNGNFNAVFTPLKGEAGSYEIGATHPGEKDFLIQDRFTLLGLRFEPVYLAQTLRPGVTITNEVVIRNLSDRPLTGLSTAVGQIDGLTVEVYAPDEIPANGTVRALITATAPEPRDAVGRYVVLYGNAEGVETELTVDYKIELPLPRLVAHPSQLRAGMVRDAQTLVEFELSNVGGAESGPLDITLPSLPWLRPITASPMESLQPGESVTITLQLAPDSSLALSEYDGRLAIGNSEVGVVMPFVFRHVSEAVGDVSISAVDENTYYGESKAKVAGAEVALRDVYSSEVLFKGVTGPDGVVHFNRVPEGPYNMEVSADKHDTWLQTIEVKPGRLSEFSAFLRTQLVRYNWKVEEIDIEERAKITLESTFETTVPVPVVTVEPGVVDLTGRTEDEVQIEFKVTNQGLIAAQDVALKFEDGSTWTVHPLTDDLGVIPAKSSITVPVIFRRNLEGQSLARQSFGVTPRTVDDCRKASIGFEWKIVCGPFDVAYWAPVPTIDMGLCPPPKTITIARDPLFFLDPLPAPPRPKPGSRPGRTTFPNETGWGIRNFVGFQGTNDCSCVKQGFEEKCKESEKLDVKLDLGEKMKEAINLALQRIAWTRLMSFEIKFEGSAKLCTCCETIDGHEIRGLKAEGNLGATITGTIFLGPSIAHEGEVSVPGLSGAKGSFFIGGGAQATLTGSGTISGKTKCLLTDPEACIEGKVSFTSFVGIKGTGSIEGKNGEVTLSGEAEVEGGIDAGMNAGVQICIDKNGTRGKLYACTDAIVLKAGGKVSLKAKEGEEELPFEQTFGMTPKELIPQFCAEKTFGEPTPTPPPTEAMLVAALLGHDSPADLVASVTGNDALSERITEAATGQEISDAIISGMESDPAAPAIDGTVVYESKVIAAGEPATDAPLARQAEQGGVCAQVRLQIDQQAVVTRKAIRATLEIFNESDSPLENVGLTIQIYDSLGQLANDRFIILAPELTTLQTVETSPDDRLILGGQAMRLAASSTGTAKWTILPKDEAAPEEALRYFVGGYLSYTADGIPSTAEMIPAPVNVYPNAKIYLKYFHQRDVFSDDPFTPQVEPSIPYVLGVMVQNKGKGVARNFSITSAQPQIVDNLKGLLIDFSIIASEVAGQSITPSLSVSFGDIQPGDTSIGRWLLKSTLQGLFIDYKATLQHEDIFGEKGASVFEGVEIHELIKQVEAPGLFNDSKPDFLANDITDPEDLPDTLHLSDGSITPVDVIRIAATDGAPTSEDLEVQLSAAMPGGWAYLRVPDPANGQFRLAGVRRSDGQQIPVDVNAWITDRTFVGMGRPPRYENTLHLLDHDSTGSYTLIYARDDRTPDTTSPVSTIAALAPAAPALIPVRWSGTDDENGSGVATFDIYVSVDDGPFLRWLEATRNSSGLYPGAAGRKYAFYSVAKDNAGNYEQPPVVADAVTTATGNSAPIIATVPDGTVNEGETFTTTISASDADLPGDALTFALVSGPEGAQIDPDSGAISWITSEADGPASHTLVVVVTDNGDPAMTAERSFRVTVLENNNAPQLVLPASVTGSEDAPMTFTAQATDVDLPANNLRFRITGAAPQGATINAVSGVFQWQPGETDGGKTYSIGIEVADNSTPNLTASGVVSLTVDEINLAPALKPIRDRHALEAELLELAVNASDSDLPVQALLYALAEGSPAGATIDPASGVFQWVPSEEQAGDHLITVIVSDDGDPVMTAEEAFNITVTALKPGLNAPRRLANGHVTFRVKSAAGLRFELQASTDLENWTAVQEFVAPEPIFTLIDETSESFPWRFFRLRQLP